MNRRVVITGMGVISPVGCSLEEFWNSLTSGKTGIGRITRFDPSAFATQIAGEIKNFDPSPYIERKALRRMDRFVQFAIVASEQAIKDAGLDFSKEDPRRVGVVVGSGIGGTETWETQHSNLISSGPDRVSPFFVPMMIIDMASGEISMRIGVRGPNFATVSACASGANAIGESFSIIARGKAEIMITGGSEAAVTPLSIAGFCSMKALSRRNSEPERASRPFDKERDGFVMGEGAGIVVLEELEHAKNRNAKVYAEVIGYGATADAYHITAPAPDGKGVIEAMMGAIDSGSISPTEVDYINAHGTSTDLNDKLETQAIKTVFGEHSKHLLVSSTKSMIGHLLGAAGGVELIATALTIERGIVHPTINYEVPDPECDLNYVPNFAVDRKIRVALSNSFGFGGHNACLALKKYEG